MPGGREFDSGFPKNVKFPGGSSLPATLGLNIDRGINPSFTSKIWLLLQVEDAEFAKQ